MLPKVKTFSGEKKKKRKRDVFLIIFSLAFQTKIKWVLDSTSAAAVQRKCYPSSSDSYWPSDFKSIVMT